MMLAHGAVQAPGAAAAEYFCTFSQPQVDATDGLATPGEADVCVDLPSLMAKTSHTLPPTTALPGLGHPTPRPPNSRLVVVPAA